MSRPRSKKPMSFIDLFWYKISTIRAYFLSFMNNENNEEETKHNKKNLSPEKLLSTRVANAGLTTVALHLGHAAASEHPNYKKPTPAPKPATTNTGTSAVVVSEEPRRTQRLSSSRPFISFSAGIGGYMGFSSDPKPPSPSFRY